jgi:hypothetical protein
MKFYLERPVRQAPARTLNNLVFMFNKDIPLSRVRNVMVGLRRFRLNVLELYVTAAANYRRSFVAEKY